MQTFLPYPSFTESAKALDRQRLGKQRVEAMQILKVLAGETSGWAHHPAVQMWKGHESALAAYGWTMCAEWKRRGYRDNLTPFFDAYAWGGRSPAWLGDPALHASHRSNLLRKYPEWYGQYGWTEPNTLPYVWPR